MAEDQKETQADRDRLAAEFLERHARRQRLMDAAFEAGKASALASEPSGD